MVRVRGVTLPTPSAIYPPQNSRMISDVGNEPGIKSLCFLAYRNHHNLFN